MKYDWRRDEEVLEEIPPEYWNSRVGDQFSLEMDITIYWPWVRPCWEENQG